jgi:hypothetical protein
MPPESWLVLTVAAAFLLLGVAGSPLAWAFLYQRRSRFEQLMERTSRNLSHELHALSERLTQLETKSATRSKPSDLTRTSAVGGQSLAHTADGFERAEGAMARPAPYSLSGGRGAIRNATAHEPTLIAVPNLEDAPGNREVTAGALKERYAAIWTLADKGASVDVIARATGQPVGQIELILALRRRIDETKSISAHAPHG